MKIWPEGQAEPPAWDVTGVAPAGTDLASGCLLLLLHHADASYGDVTVTPL